MSRLRGLVSITLLCVVAGIAGGLGLGYLLSRRGEWLVPQPWLIYAAALFVVTGALTWLDVRRRPSSPAGANAATGLGEAVGEPTATASPEAEAGETGGVVE